MLSDNEKYQLQRMVESNQVVDQTQKIRELKHSGEIRRCIGNILEHKKQFPELLKSNKVQFEEEIMRENNFLFFHYMPIFNMVMKDVDLTILDRLLSVLEQIELGTCDQHEGSFVVGKILKELYIDTVIRETNARDHEHATTRAEPKAISWNEFKNKA
jgi:hypothetical protein